MIVDTVMFNREFEILEARLLELENVPSLVTVCVEADVDHQDHPKPFHLTENLGRFDAWRDRLVVVRATGLPTAVEAPDPWAREMAQREHAIKALAALELAPDDVILHGDVDEIPTVLAVRNVKPRGMVAFEQRGHFWAVDWLWPQPWRGTVATTVRGFMSFNAMRNSRNTARSIPEAGWHLSWLPQGEETSEETALAKVGSFCHPEVKDRIVAGIAEGRFLADGMHVDGARMIPVDVDDSWPRYIREGRCPKSWFRPR